MLVSVCTTSVAVILYDFVNIGSNDYVHNMLLRSIYCEFVCYQGQICFFLKRPIFA